MSYYEYRHYAGYGRHDHMADEIIARAAAYLGADGAGEHLLRCVGLADHAVGDMGCTVRMPYAPGVRAQMERALRQAYGDMRRNHWARDCRIEVVCLRQRSGKRGIETEIREGRRWMPV